MSRTTRSSCSRSCRSLLGLLLSLTLLLGLSGCGSGGDEAPVLRVGVALYSQDDTFISALVQHLERLAREEEQQRQIQIRLSVMDGGSNQTTQLEQVDRLIGQDCDVLCVNIVDRTAAAVLVDKAEEADIPLIFFNRQPVAEDIARWEKVYYVGARAEESGTLQGQLVLRSWLSDPEVDRNGDGVLQYVMLEGEPGHQDTLLRTAYSVKVLTDAGVSVEKLAGESASWKRGQAMLKVQQWLPELGEDIEVIFSNNDDMALGAIDAYREAGLPLPVVVGVDATEPALESLRNGELYGTVLNDGKGIAQAMMDLILALTDGSDPADAVELVEEHYVWLPYRAVTLANVDSVMDSGT